MLVNRLSTSSDARSLGLLIVLAICLAQKGFSRSDQGRDFRSGKVQQRIRLVRGDVIFRDCDR